MSNIYNFLNRTSELLRLVLGIGNYLHGGTDDGQAFGFKLDSLTQLGTIKTIDKRSTLCGHAKIASRKGSNFRILGYLLPLNSRFALAGSTSRRTSGSRASGVE